MRSILRQKLFPAVILLFIFLCFSTSKFSATVDHDWFRKHQTDSDNLVYKSLMMVKLGRNAPIGLTNWELDVQATAFIGPKAYGELYTKSAFPNNYYLYVSQVGLQTTILYPFYYIASLWSSEIGEDFHRSARAVHQVVIFMNAAVFTCLFLWVANEFNKKTAALSVVLFPSVAPWAVIFGHSPYWMMWSWFLPFLTALLYWQRQTGPPSKKSIRYFYFALTACFLLKMLMGYEYISTVAIAASTPIVFYALLCGWKTFYIIQHIIITGVTSIVALFIALSAHVLMLKQWGFNTSDAIVVIMSRFFVRTFHAFTDGVSAKPIVIESLNASLSSVIKTYLIGGRGVPEYLFILTAVCIIILYASFSKHYDKTCNRKKNYALFICTLYSFIAPLSHHIIMKGHSYIHTGMNYVLWWLPLNLFFLISITYIISSLFEFKKHTFYE